MINGVGIPVLTPLKFNPIDPTIGDGVNFQNVDNTELHLQDWEGVYPKRFVQPVARYWNDLSPGIDFQIYLDTSILSFGNFEARIVDLEGATVQDLITEDFFTITGTIHQVRVYADEFNYIADGCYRIKLIASGAADLYLSEVIQLADTIDDCYPLEYSNFENDFGLIFTGTSDTWKGKVLVPMRMYKPLPSDEREMYKNDPGEIVTLRSVPQRKYEFETFPVSTWYAELFKLIFSCSDLTLNKSIVNTEETPTPEIIEETDVMQITGEVALNDFVDGYLQDAKLDTLQNTLTSWVDVGWDTFNDTAKDINEAEAQLVVATATSNNIAVVDETYYLVKLDITSSENATPTLEVGAESYTLNLDDSLISKSYYFIYRAVSTGNITLVITTKNTEITHFAAICNVFKIS